MLTTQAQIRQAFWRDHPNLPRKPGNQNAQPADTRAAFVDYVDLLQRSGEISEALADRVTL